MSAPKEVVQAVMEAHGGVRSDYGNDFDVPYCSECGDEWLDGRGCCHAVAVDADAAFSAAVPVLLARVRALGQELMGPDPEATPDEDWRCGNALILLLDKIEAEVTG